MGGFQRDGVPDATQLAADPLANGSIRGVVDSILGQMELTALPDRPGKDGLTGGTQPGVIVTGPLDSILTPSVPNDVMTMLP